ncbi:hypothetical protein [Streptomyces sp. NPDC057910]
MEANESEIRQEWTAHAVAAAVEATAPLFHELDTVLDQLVTDDPEPP